MPKLLRPRRWFPSPLEWTQSESSPPESTAWYFKFHNPTLKDKNFLKNENNNNIKCSSEGVLVLEWQIPNDEHAVQQIDGDAVGREHVRSSNGADASVRGEYHDGRERRLQGAVQKGEALDVQHMHLKK